MIAAALFAQSVLQVSFSPPLVFAGEPFHINAPSGIDLSAIANLRKQGGFWIAQKPVPAEIWSIERKGNDLRDAAKIPVPLALVPRWQTWPTESGSLGGAAFLIRKGFNLALVPMDGNFELCIEQDGAERRWANTIRLDIAVRSGPKHERAIAADYIYAGKEHITLSARPDRVARLIIAITGDSIETTLLAEYQMAGTLSVLNQTKQISLAKGEKISMTISFPR